MSSEGSVTHWLNLLKAGDQAATQKLWENYFQRLVALARVKLRDLPRRAADEEDVALSAFESLCRGVERGRFPQLNDRNDLWRLLVTITVRKAIHLIREQDTLKRGGGAVRGESVFLDLNSSSPGESGIDQFLGREPSPEFAAEVAETCRGLLEQLGNNELRSIALWKMEGYTSEEIAVKLGRALSTIERKLGLIRALWSREREHE
jgi:DNA-directed RNA polymerase specialized sigma24 family protein